MDRPDTDFDGVRVAEKFFQLAAEIRKDDPTARLSEVHDVALKSGLWAEWTEKPLTSTKKSATLRSRA